MNGEKQYQALVGEQIFFGGANDVEQMIKDDNCEIIVDLRAEAEQCAYPAGGVQWIKIPIGDDSGENLDELFKDAVDAITTAYSDNKKVGFHCGGGKGRTGAVAIATLLALGLASNVEEAEQKVKEIRPVVNVKPFQKEALLRLACSIILASR
ncbi:protein-tyrosine phosphatase family protein [Paenibacillus alkalitolerans]|uniref:protein-tyrosine phosphatase family protein n=1 Tax=Paenibacillus alkalitolerans TaxID=2799335 RepID=UPI0018F60D32|nr:dual specificity protein phosphatase family protein [Paenibacillus alkalitolerans]